LGKREKKKSVKRRGRLDVFLMLKRTKSRRHKKTLEGFDRGKKKKKAQSGRSKGGRYNTKRR